ncbi:LysR family transcriptional regulator [Pleomorphomonas diazotrophica]|uniref:LysR family transcriptional regulator n=1 Tax=Pleomorphomonas diazotrophica TaxID=1166257 RepID=A0A1I4UXJ8_9HYPH|nr:LysR substrate-binding domain-containing protein [Pleomorphomonas diazotrophica]PKR89727.1 LysR family transcriptional regulator [Pleomorphomonas diazotrophica]SFM93682.1 DNA-binding transcriptional regulator, LysR family [Pleomorphomonas diazotrophica]
MDRDILQHLPVVAAVARRRSFAAAAAELGLGASAVSHAVRLVEDRLRTPLFARTTRSVSLTEAGEAFLARALPALEAIHDAAEATLAMKGRVTGLLRINSPRVALPMLLIDLLADMAGLHPDLTVEVTTEDALIDIVAGGYDAGIRLGEMIAEDMVAVRLTPPFKAIMVASPAYLAKAAGIDTVDDLGAHNCIGFRQASTGGTYAWEVLDKGEDRAIVTRGTARVTDPLMALDLALAGVGIAYVFEPLARRHIASGALRWLLPDSAIEEPGLFLYFPRRASEAPKLRAFIDAARRRAPSWATRGKGAP